MPDTPDPEFKKKLGPRRLIASRTARAARHQAPSAPPRSAWNDREEITARALAGGRSVHGDQPFSCVQCDSDALPTRCREEPVE